MKPNLHQYSISSMWEKLKFLFKNFGKAILYFAFLIGLFLLFKEFVFNPNKEVWKGYLYNHTPLIYISYIFSEICFGLIPPEVYMKWALHKVQNQHYVLDVSIFAMISYGAGVLAFYIGRYLRKAVLFRYMTRKAFSKYWPMFRVYGGVLIIAAAMTPLPWALVSMLIGTTEYKITRYLAFACTRLLRFALYGYLLYAAV